MEFERLTGGLAFGASAFPPEYQSHAFVARWNGQNGIIDGLDYRDIVLVDRMTGDVEQVVAGLNAPIDLLADAHGNLLVASYYGSLWRISALPPTYVPTLGAAVLPLLPLAVASSALLALRRKPRNTRRF